MKKFAAILVQSAFIAVVSAALGFVVNALSTEPLSLVREEIVQEHHDEKWEQLTADVVVEHINNGTAILIDARDPNEYEAGHILSALNIPENQFFEAFQELGDSLPREIPLVVYCQGGDCDQSHSVLEHLSEFGFEVLYLYQEGWNEWKELGYPSEP